MFPVADNWSPAPPTEPGPSGSDTRPSETPVSARAAFQPERLDHLGVERIGLGEAAHGPCEVADLARVDDAKRQPGAGEGRRDGGFEAARSLEDNESDG
mgnify:CR=1 FL=1